MRIMRMGSTPAGFGMRTLSKSPRWIFQKINAGGVRHSEIARRLRVTGYPAEKITEMAELKEVFQRIQQQETPHAYILATYTAMLEFRELLAQEHLIEKEMH